MSAAQGLSDPGTRVRHPSSSGSPQLAWPCPISVPCGNLKMFLLSSCLFCRCVSKKESFAPGTMYKPFGKEAAGTMTLSQFQTLHEKDQETASLRELGLNETEILIWKSHVSGEKVSGAIFFSGE